MRDVLVVQLARFGDIIQTKRLMLSIAARDRVHLCVDTSLAGLAARLYPFATIHPLPCHRGSETADRLFPSLEKELKLLRSIGFAEIYFLNSSPLTYALASLFPPEICRGYATDRGQPVRSAWTRTASRMVRKRPLAALNLMDLWALHHPRPIRPEKVNPIPRHAGTNRIGLVMAGRNARRSLPLEILAQTVQAVFQARKGPALVCLGGKAERPLVRRLSRLLPARTVDKIEDTTGTTALTDLFDLLSGLDLLLTPDTGTMHLAAHLGVPIHAFFLSSAWCFETGPYGMGHKLWQALTDCSPCLESQPCEKGVKCLPPFVHKGALAHLAGKYQADWPNGLLACVTTLDSLGVNCSVVDGLDPRAEERAGLRNALKELFHLPGRGRITGSAISLLYEEEDWMLPSPGPAAPWRRPVTDHPTGYPAPAAGGNNQQTAK